MASSMDSSSSGGSVSPSARKTSFRRMLDLEKKNKLERTEYAPHRVLPAPPSGPPRPPRLQKGHVPPSPMAPILHSQPMKRAMTAPFVPTLSALSQEIETPQTPPEIPERKMVEKRRGASQPRLQIDVPGNDAGSESDRSSICQSPGWDNAAKAKKKKQEAKEKRKQEKAQAEKNAKQTKKLQKRMSKPPPTNKIFNRMAATPMERSISAPVLDKVSEEQSNKETPSRPSSSSRRGSLEASFKTLKNLPGPWKHDNQSPSQEPQPLPTTGFVGGLKLKREQEVALRESVQKFAFPVQGPVHNFSKSTSAHSRSISESQHPALRDPRDYLQSELTMSPVELESSYSHNPRRASMPYEQGSYASRISGNEELETSTAVEPIMERKIKRRPKSRIFAVEELSHSTEKNPQNSMHHSAAIETENSLQRASPMLSNESPDARRSSKTSISVVFPFTRSATEPVARSSDEAATADQSRGRAGNNSAETEREQSRGRPFLAQHQQDRRASTNSCQSTASKADDGPGHRSPSAQPLGPVDGSSDEEIGSNFAPNNDNDDKFDRNHDSYHAFLAGNKNPQYDLPEAYKDEKISKQYPNSPSFKNFRSAAKAAFSRTSPYPPMPQVGTNSAARSQSSDRPSRTLTMKGSHRRNLSKAERILGESMPSVPAMANSNMSSRTSEHSSSHSSEEFSMLDEMSNITTPTGSRPQSQKDDILPEKTLQSNSGTTSFQVELRSYDSDGEDRSGTPNSIGLDEHFHVRSLFENNSTPELSKITKFETADQSSAIDSLQEDSAEDDLQRRPSITRSYSTPELQDLSFLPPLKHQPLARPFKGKEKENEVTKTTRPQLAPITIHKKEDRSLVRAPSSAKITSPVKAGSSEYLQNARLNVLRSGPPQLSKTGRIPTMHTPPSPGQPPSPGVEPIAKMFVVCCSCNYFHDMPSKIYECMAKPDNVVEDKDLGVSGHITTMVRCPWCSHGMSTQCCAGYAAIVYMQEKLH